MSNTNIAPTRSSATVVQTSTQANPQQLTLAQALSHAADRAKAMGSDALAGLVKFMNATPAEVAENRKQVLQNLK